MNEKLKFEKDYYGKIYSDISEAIFSLSPFLGDREKKRRKYFSKQEVLRDYIKTIDLAQEKISKKGIFSVFIKDDVEKEVMDFKFKNKEILDRLEKCSKCKCLNCSKECPFDGCLGCRDGANICMCDHEKHNMSKQTKYYLDLINEKTGREEKYKVLAIIQNLQENKRYIVIEGTVSQEKYILYYYPGVSEDEFGEIKDENEFDEIVEIYEFNK